MPAPLNVNREAVKTLAIALGVRAAAREMGLDESTVRQWSSRGKWFAKPSQPPTVRPVATVTKAPAAGMADALARLGESSRVHLAKAGNKASKHFAKLTGGKVARQSGDFKNIAQALAPVHGWTDKSGPAANVMVNVALLGVNPGELGASGDVS